MDLLSQGLLGTSVALAVAKPNDIKKAALIGLLAGLAADLDFFIRSNSDPLLNLEFHRHFTHSIFFIPLAALILSLLFWPFFKNHLSWPRIFIYSLFGYLLSGFLDACTSYGTRLLWPISNERINFNIISIIDPVFTLLLLTGVIFTLVKRNPRFTQVFLIFAASYLMLGWFQHNRVDQITHQLAEQKGHKIDHSLVKPTLGNLFLWRSVYLHNDRFYINAVRVNPFSGSSRVFPGDNIQRFDSNINQLGIPVDSILHKDITRFSYFSSGFLALNPQDSSNIIDVRYSNLPNNLQPLWSIQIDAQSPYRHADFLISRDSSEPTRNSFIDMLLDKE